MARLISEKENLISVVITTCNRRQLVTRAIESVYQQTRFPHEIIVIDDGSHDGTEHMIRERYPDIIYHWQPNQGISTARNNGISLSRGEWIAFLDGDDEWLPDKLRLQTESLQMHPEFSICHTDEIWIRRGKRVNQMNKHRKSGGYIFERCLPLCIISPSSVMIARQIFDEIGMFDPRLPVCEDYDLWLRICSRLPVLFIDQPLIIKYGGHKDQLSRKFWGMDRFRITALEHLLEDGHLDTAQEQAVLGTLIEKVTIVRDGAQKRGNKALQIKYEEKLAKFTGRYSAS